MAKFEYRYGIRPQNKLAQYIYDEAIRVIDNRAEFADIHELKNYLDEMQKHLMKQKKYCRSKPVVFEHWFDKYHDVTCYNLFTQSDNRVFLGIKETNPPV